MSVWHDWISFNLKTIVDNIIIFVVLSSKSLNRLINFDIKSFTAIIRLYNVSQLYIHIVIQIIPTRHEFNYFLITYFIKLHHTITRNVIVHLLSLWILYTIRFCIYESINENVLLKISWEYKIRNKCFDLVTIMGSETGFKF